MYQDILVATESMAKLQKHIEAIKAHTSSVSYCVIVMFISG